jgi:hypothetical protein
MEFKKASVIYPSEVESTTKKALRQMGPKQDLGMANCPM